MTEFKDIYHVGLLQKTEALLRKKTIFTYKLFIIGTVTDPLLANSLLDQESTFETLSSSFALIEASHKNPQTAKAWIKEASLKITNKSKTYKKIIVIE